MVRVRFVQRMEQLQWRGVLVLTSFSAFLPIVMEVRRKSRVEASAWKTYLHSSGIASLLHAEDLKLHNLLDLLWLLLILARVGCYDQ